MPDYLQPLPRGSADGGAADSTAAESVQPADYNRLVGVLNGTAGTVGANFRNANSIAANPLYEVAGVTAGKPFYNAANPAYAGGVRMDGVTDDMPALKSVAAAATINGGKIVVPPGTAFCNYNGDGNGIRATTKSLIFQGAGRGATFFTSFATVQTATSVLFSAAIGADIEIEDMDITGPLDQSFTSIGVTHTGGASNAGWNRIRRCNIRQFTVNTKYDNGSSIFIDDCDFGGFATGGTKACTCVQAGSGAGNPGEVRIYRTSFHDYGDHAGSNLWHAMYLADGNAIDLAHIFASSQFGTGYTLQVWAAPYTPALRCNIEDFNCDASTYQGILTSPTVKTNITAGRINSTNRAVISQNDVEIFGLDCIGQSGFCVQQFGGSVTARIIIHGGRLDCATPIAASTSGTVVVTEGVEFSGSNYDITTNITGGATWTTPVNCKFANTGWNFRTATFGDGTDPDFTADGIATPQWATLAGSVYTVTRTPYIKTLTVNTGITIKMQGFPLFVWSLIINGTGAINSDGNAAVGATGGANLPSNFFTNISAGANGGTGAGTNSVAGSSNTSLGSAGGAGGTSGANGGGTAGSVGGRYLGSAGATSFPFPHTLPPYQTGAALSSSSGNFARFCGGNGGGSGGGDGVNAGGGGGGGGGVLVIFASLVNNAGTLSANGGAGAAGVAGNAAGGGGGGGGFVGLFYGTLVAVGTVQANGGAFGAGVGTGGPGIVGSNGFTLKMAA